jgi:MYXO-CTERM domain-containing protein
VGFTPGERPAADTPLCGSTGKGAGDGRATGLQNGVLYAVGVAAVDALGNRGKLSNVTCGTPEVVEDFFEIYRASGGKGGGGFCGLSSQASDAPGAWVAALMVLGLLIARRRN